MNTYSDKVKNKSDSVAIQSPMKQKSRAVGLTFLDNRPESVAQRKIQEMINTTSRNLQLKAIINAARIRSNRAVMQRVVAPGLLPGTHVVINAGHLAGTVVTIHHENPNYHGNHVYFVNIPGIGIPVALLLNEMNPGAPAVPMGAMAAAAA